MLFKRNELTITKCKLNENKYVPEQSNNNLITFSQYGSR